MRVIFDARHLQTVSRSRGIGRYSRNLLAAFAAQATADIDWTLLRLRNFPAADQSPAPPHRERAVLRPRRPELAMLALDALLLPLELPAADVYHSVQLGLPARTRARTVITIHDLAPLRWPEAYLRLPHARVGHAWQYALARRADAVIAPSRDTARDVTLRLGVPEERVHVIPEAVDLAFAPPSRSDAERTVKERFGTDHYVLYVGQFDPRKNMEGLLAAFAAAAERDTALSLVVVGDLGRLRAHLDAALARTRATRHRIVLTGFVDDATLAALYAGARCLLHAALLEGFGLTPLESLAAGTPVVGYRAGAVEEIVGDAGVLVEPGGDELAQALVALLADEPRLEALRTRAKPRAAAFSWERAADATLALYRALA